MTRPALLVAGVLAASAASAASTATAAAADESGSPLVVTAADGARAVVERSPFRLSFQGAEGRTVLHHVDGRRVGPRRLPSTDDPEPFALELRPDRAVYAPLTFEVGREARPQWDAGLWGGSVLFSRRSGTVHAARSVVSARRRGRALRLVVSTTDRRRRLLVDIAPDRGPALRVRARLTDPGGVISVADSFAAGRREGFHGFGGRHSTVDKHGEKLYGWTEQEALGGRATITRGLPLLPGLVRDWSASTIDRLGGFRPDYIPGRLPGGFERYMVPGGPNAAYYPQAQFVSSRGYGFLLNRPEFSRWRMGNDRRDAWQVQASAPELDYTVTVGRTPSRAMGALTAITGRHLLPPRWAQGATVWRAVRVPPLPGVPAPETKESYRAKIERDLADLERYDVRLSAYAFEGWALLENLPYVRSVIRRLHRRGIKVILYHRAYVANDTLNTQPREDFAQTARQGLVARTRSGRPYYYGANGGGRATLLDFTNPRTVRWWKRRLELTLGLGMDGFMQDFGEQVQEDMRFADGSTGRTMHNRYPVIWHRVSRRILDAWTRARPGRARIWFFTRAGYSGRPGSAAYEMGNFPGDETTDWEAASGLRSLAPDMLNRAVGGAFGFTGDIGGYADFLSGGTTEELFERWSEWTALTPYFRVHNSASTGTRMPWDFSPGTLRRWKALAALHDRATPLIRRLWRQGRRTGVPPTRPMWLGAPEAPGARGDAQQWLLGEDVLVAPVVRRGARTRRVALPRGCWQLQASGRRSVRGPGRVTVDAPVGRLPYFFRCGKRPF